MVVESGDAESADIEGQLKLIFLNLWATCIYYKVPVFSFVSLLVLLLVLLLNQVDAVLKRRKNKENLSRKKQGPASSMLNPYKILIETTAEKWILKSNLTNT